MYIIISHPCPSFPHHHFNFDQLQHCSCVLSSFTLVQLCTGYIMFLTRAPSTIFIGDTGTLNKFHHCPGAAETFGLLRHSACPPVVAIPDELDAVDLV